MTEHISFKIMRKEYVSMEGVKIFTVYGCIKVLPFQCQIQPSPPFPLAADLPITGQITKFIKILTVPGCPLWSFPKKLELHMGHQDQDGEKVGLMSLFYLKVRGCYGQRKAKIHTLLSPTILSQLVEYLKFEFQVLGVIQGVHGTPKVGCFFKAFKIQLFLLLYYSAS